MMPFKEARGRARGTKEEGGGGYSEDGGKDKGIVCTSRGQGKRDAGVIILSVKASS